MNNKLFALILVGACLWSIVGAASGIDKNTAKMQAMDKITGRVSVIYVPVGGAVNFGSLSIAVRACKTRPEEETPDNFVFADIADKTLQGQDVNIFRGWMISSSPATNAVEHPIYDVWLLQCLDKKVDKKLLLTEAQFAERETFTLVRNTDTPSSVLQADENEQPRQMQEMTEDEHKSVVLQPSVEFSYDEAGEEIVISESSAMEESTEEGLKMPELPEISVGE